MWNSAGENNKRAKLDWPKVRKIRFLAKFGKVSQRELALKFGVAQTMIGKIVRGDSWKEY